MRAQWPAYASGKECQESADWDEDKFKEPEKQPAKEHKKADLVAEAKSEEVEAPSQMSGQNYPAKLSQDSVKIKKLDKVTERWKKRAQRLKKDAQRVHEVEQQLEDKTGLAKRLRS